VTPSLAIAFPTTGRLLGVDPGRVRIGLAVCERDQQLAFPLETVQVSSPQANAQYFAKVVKREEIVGLVVGLPLHMDGQEGDQAQKARLWGAQLATWVSRPVTFWDERCTSHAAEGLLWDAGLTHQQRKARQDALAAALLLQSFLDARKTSSAVPATYEPS